ncbi:MAG: ankyrin repeat domain-containing protein [Candidatus Babeliaceae bacterium]
MNNKQILFLTALFFLITHPLNCMSNKNQQAPIKKNNIIATITHTVSKKLYGQEYPNIILNNGKTPLTLAIKLRNLNSIKKLLDFGADINMQDRADGTPISIALEALQSKILFKKFLLNNECHLEELCMSVIEKTVDQKYLKRNIKSIALSKKIFKYLLIHSNKNQSAVINKEIYINHQEIKNIYIEYVQQRWEKEQIGLMIIEKYMRAPEDSTCPALPKEIIQEIFSYIK